MDTKRDNPAPYGSAHDLPSVVEMRHMLGGINLLTRIVARDQRQRVIELEGQLDALFDLVDRFYDILGARHWIFTEHLPVSDVEALLATAPTEAVAEAGLIEIIAERLRGPHWQMGLRAHAAMRARLVNLERARRHYLDEQWASCALVLVTVMDGFINDIEPAVRRGLHARDPEELVAWDSLVGHHMGLTAVMPVFLKPCKRRQDEEVFELYRHGMVHGTVVNYDNKIVASKAWNMLAAVVDWALAKEKERRPVEPKPTLRGALAALVEHAENKRCRETFEPWMVAADEAGFAELEVVRRATAFLESWQTKQWGLVAQSLPWSVVKRDTTSGRGAVLAKQIYEHTLLIEFEITSVSFPQASVAVIHGTGTIGGNTGPIEIRWVSEGADGNPAKAGDEDARWVLAVFPPRTFIKEGAAWSPVRGRA